METHKYKVPDTTDINTVFIPDLANIIFKYF